MTAAGRQEQTMNEPTLNTAEERSWFDQWAARCDADPSLERHEGYLELLENILAFRVAEAVDRERAAWATKIETLANDADLRGQASLNRTFDGGWLPAIIRPADLRALLAAGDTEGKP